MTEDDIIITIGLRFNDVNESLARTLLSPSDNVQRYNGTIVHYEEVI
jgi:hypothetical protein